MTAAALQNEPAALPAGPPTLDGAMTEQWAGFSAYVRFERVEPEHNRRRYYDSGGEGDMRPANADDIVTELIERCRRDHHAWINGDASGYAFEREDDTIMGPFGGVGVGASSLTPVQQRVAARFESGSGEIELVRGGVSGDVAWLAMIERASVRFAGRTEPHRWELRVTEIFQRDGDRWRRTHRQADPLVDRRPFDDVLSLLS
jgi:ketosteroid isomerase-like protein